jgi:hypothetical protein
MPNDHIRSFGFPRWGEYGKDKDAEVVRMCDYSGCNERADHPAPKSPGSNERWYFCRPHASEYNRNWNFFEGLSEEEIERQMKDNSESSDAFAGAGTYEWGGALDENGFSSTEQAAFDALDLDSGADQDAIKRQYRKLAKMFHPDANPGDPAASERFHQIQSAYDLLKE